MSSHVHWGPFAALLISFALWVCSLVHVANLRVVLQPGDSIWRWTSLPGTSQRMTIRRRLTAITFASASIMTLGFMSAAFDLPIGLKQFTRIARGMTTAPLVAGGSVMTHAVISGVMRELRKSKPTWIAWIVAILACCSFLTDVSDSVLAVSMPMSIAMAYSVVIWTDVHAVCVIVIGFLLNSMAIRLIRVLNAHIIVGADKSPPASDPKPKENGLSPSSPAPPRQSGFIDRQMMQRNKLRLYYSLIIGIFSFVWGVYLLLSAPSVESVHATYIALHGSDVVGDYYVVYALLICMAQGLFVYYTASPVQWDRILARRWYLSTPCDCIEVCRRGQELEEGGGGTDGQSIVSVHTTAMGSKWVQPGGTRVVTKPRGAPLSPHGSAPSSPRGAGPAVIATISPSPGITAPPKAAWTSAEPPSVRYQVASPPASPRSLEP